MAVAIVFENGQRPAFARSDDQIIMAIIAQIEPRHARTQPAELVRQQRLAGKIVERLVLMGVLD